LWVDRLALSLPNVLTFGSHAGEVLNVKSAAAMRIDCRTIEGGEEAKVG
jgi:hypothetical protein